MTFSSMTFSTRFVARTALLGAYHAIRAASGEPKG
jgi:hypothetical protein